MATKHKIISSQKALFLSLAFLFSCFQDMSEGHYILPTFTRKEVEDDTVEDTAEDTVEDGTFNKKLLF